MVEVIKGKQTMKKQFAVYAAFLLLCACDLKMETTAKISDLLSQDSKTLLAEMKAQVSSCTDPTDPSEASEDTYKVQRMVAKSITGAQYLGCKNENFNFFTIFSVPVALSEYGSLRKEGEVFRLLRKGNTFYFDFSREVIRSLEQKSIINLTLSATIVAVNDTTETINYKTLAAFVNGEPVISGNLSLAPMQKAAIRASDVSIAQAKNGTPAYFMEIIKE